MSLADQIKAQSKGSGTIQHHTLSRAVSSSWLSGVLAGLWRSARQWGYSKKLYHLRLKGRHPVQLLASPDDPAPGDRKRGRKLLGGEFHFEDEMITVSESIWVDLYTKSPAFFAHAHRFHFLEDLAQMPDQRTAREAAEFMMRLWLESYQQWDLDVWHPGILARRQISWCVHAPLILYTNDLVYKSSVLLSMAQQARHLVRTLRDCKQGMEEIYAGTALILSGLLLPGGDAWQNRGQDFLGKAVTSFVKADGGPISRSPADAIKIMQQLIILKSAYSQVDAEHPLWLQATLDKLGPFVRALRLPDGSMAAFGGSSSMGGDTGGDAAETAFGTDAILLASDAKGRAMESAPLTGYQRLSSGQTVVIMDTAPAPAPDLSYKAGASTGAFEIADGAQKLIVSMGPAGSRTALPELATLSRMSAAFSNHIVSDCSSSLITKSGMIGKGVSETSFHRQQYEGGAVELAMGHDGYKKRFAIMVERRLNMSVDGTTIKGHEKWTTEKPKKARRAQATLRFHLHPSIQASTLDDGRIRLESSLESSLESGLETGPETGPCIWLFSVIGGETTLEDSLYMPTPGSCLPTSQIVVAATADQLLADGVRWRLSKEIAVE